MTLPTRLLDLANRLERGLADMEPTEAREALRQDVTDVREAVRLLRARRPGRWERLKGWLTGPPMTVQEWEDLQW